MHDFGPERAIVVLTAACRGHYMTRISNGFQLSLERDNVFREWVPTTPTPGEPAAIAVGPLTEQFKCHSNRITDKL